MFSRFTEKAIQIIMQAQQEAKQRGHEFVGTEHLLLGLIKGKNSTTYDVFKKLKLSSLVIKKRIDDLIKDKPKVKKPNNIIFTSQAKKTLSLAWDEARQLGHNYVNVEHILLALIKDQQSTAAKAFSSLSITSEDLKDTLVRVLEENIVVPDIDYEDDYENNTPILDSYSRDLTKFAREGKLDPVVGRKNEVERIIQILSRRTKNNPVLTGEAGVGKTAIIEGLAQKIVKRQVPEKLNNKRLVTLDLGLLVAGTKFRGEFEERLKGIMEEISDCNNVILFIDEIHTIIGTGGVEGSLDAANMFKPALSRGELQCIGATTLNEYRKYIEGDSALERRFQSVFVKEPSVSETILILKGIRSQYEDFHAVKITNKALEAAAKLSARYISERQLPDKAIDLVDEAAARAIIKNQKKCVVNEETIAEVVSSWTGIPTLQLTEEEIKRLQNMHKEIEKKIIGQEEAVASITKAIKRSKAGLKDPNRPIGSFMFLGPSGVGKTELSKVIAEFMFGSRDDLIRIDMSEYTEKHTTARLIGSPPGYIGHKEGGQLTDAVRKKPYSIILFDEIEKSSREVLSLLLQIMEDGRLTDSLGRVVDFKNTIILMTSNVGAKLIEKTEGFGFVSEENKEKINYERMKLKIKEELKKQFTPEFLSRIDDIIIFKALNITDIKKISKLLIRELNQRLAEKQVKLKVSSEVISFLASKGYDSRHGARSLRRIIQEYLEDNLSDRLLSGEYMPGTTFKTILKNGKLDFLVDASPSSKIKKRTSKKMLTPQKASKSYAFN